MNTRFEKFLSTCLLISFIPLKTFAFDLYVFQPGELIDAAKLNQNFNSIKTELELRNYSIEFSPLLYPGPIKKTILENNFLNFKTLEPSISLQLNLGPKVSSSQLNYNFNAMKEIVSNKLSRKSCDLSNGEGFILFNPETSAFDGECKAVECNLGFFKVNEDSKCSAYSKDTTDGLWPQGTNGSLILEVNETRTLPAGTYDYSLVHIKSGATLTIIGEQPTVIGSVGDIIIDGKIEGKSINAAGNFSVSTPRGKQFSYTTPQALGGSGGVGGQEYNTGAYGGAGGAGTNGCGGGGGGGRYNSSSTGGAGGAGCGAGYSGTNNANPTPQLLSNGSTINGQGGTPSNIAGNELASGTFVLNLGAGYGGGSGGGAAYGSKNSTGKLFISGGGGGGGLKGKNGLGLYLITRKNLQGTGTLDFSGTNGFNGGNGSEGNTAQGAGGGGGGGAGGSGGTILIEYNEKNLSSLNINVSPGAGGNPGLGPNGTCRNSFSNPVDCSSGSVTYRGGKGGDGLPGNPGVGGTYQVKQIE